MPHGIAPAAIPAKFAFSLAYIWDGIFGASRSLGLVFREWSDIAWAYVSKIVGRNLREEQRYY